MVRPVEPVVYHVPVRMTTAGEALTIRASVSCPEAVAEATVVLRVSGETRRFGMATLEGGLLYEAIFSQCAITWSDNPTPGANPLLHPIGTFTPHQHTFAQRGGETPLLDD